LAPPTSQKEKKRKEGSENPKLSEWTSRKDKLPILVMLWSNGRRKRKKRKSGTGLQVTFSNTTTWGKENASSWGARDHRRGTGRHTVGG